jgi:hypothetical protein
MAVAGFRWCHAAVFFDLERYGGAAKARVLLSFGHVHLDAIEEALKLGSRRSF